jgi:sialidase-1
MKAGIGITFLFLLLISCEKEKQPEITYDPYIEHGWKFTAKGLRIRDNVTELAVTKTGPYLRLADGSILATDSRNCLISNDEGKTWTSYAVFSEPGHVIGEHAMILTREGAVVLAFYNTGQQSQFNWSNTIHDAPGAVLPTYVTRSLDGGRSWQNLQKLHDEWTGSVRDMLQTKAGNVVFTSMMMQHNPGRHSVLTYTSKDNGVTWVRSNVIDLGGVGHHGGVTEATIEQLNDGRIWMLMRTNWKFFWEAFSDDEGLTWKDFKATTIDASSAPGQLMRMASGRLVLVWNRYYPEGHNTYPLTGGDNNWSEVPVSNHREELSIMFSENDGFTWNDPVVLAKISVIDKIKGVNNRLSYPYLFESSPGQLWITTLQGDLRASISENDYIR